LELYVLHEIGRLRRDPESIFDQTARATGLTVSSASLASVVSHATSLSWTRDPFDRLIVANAMADGCKLLTADEHIRTHFADAIW
jgi:PIN domain nuclease of toxin-antitoxin system